MARIQNKEYNVAQTNNFEKINGDYFLKVITADGQGNFSSDLKFNTNDIEEATATVTYIGAEDKAGNWYIKKIDTTSGNSFTHASENNNNSYTTYDTAWAARASLTYGNYGDAF